MITNKRLFRPGFILVWIFAIGFSFFVPYKTALAGTLPSGYQITVTESASTMDYGGGLPNFQAQLVVPADDPVMQPTNFYIMIDSHPVGGQASGSVPTYSLSLPGRLISFSGPLPVGTHSVVAAFDSPKLKTTLVSDPITFTVLKATPSLDCRFNWTYTFAVNTPLTFTLSGESTLNWQEGTYTITFVGARTFQRTNLRANSSAQVTVLTPPVGGVYRYQCTFSGTSTLNPASTALSAPDLVVSENHSSSIKLYTNPTTLKAGQTAIWEIVVSGAPGLPAPTGQVGLRIGSSFTTAINLGAGGKVLAQGALPSPLPADTIQIFYYGDPVYASSNATFSLTNPSIPTSGSNQPQSTPTVVTGASGTPGSSVTPTITAGTANTPAASATPTVSAVAASGGSSGHNSTPSSFNQSNILIWMVIAALVLLVTGGIVGFIALRQRAISTVTPPGPSNWTP